MPPETERPEVSGDKKHLLLHEVKHILALARKAGSRKARTALLRDDVFEGFERANLDNFTGGARFDGDRLAGTGVVAGARGARGLVLDGHFDEALDGDRVAGLKLRLDDGGHGVEDLLDLGFGEPSLLGDLAGHLGLGERGRFGLLSGRHGEFEVRVCRAHIFPETKAGRRKLDRAAIPR